MDNIVKNNTYIAIYKKALMLSVVSICVFFTSAIIIGYTFFSVIGLIIGIFLIVISVILFYLSLKLHKINTHISAYLSLMAGYKKISLSSLSSSLNLPIDNIKKELEIFSENNLIPTGRLSNDGNYFKIGDLEGEELVDINEEHSSTNENLDFIEIGRNYIKILEKANSSMYSNKFFAEPLEKAIFAAEVLYKYVENYPGKIPAIKINVNKGFEDAIAFINKYKELARYSIDSQKIKDLKEATSLALIKVSDDCVAVYSAIKIPENNSKDNVIIAKNATEIIKAGRAYVRRIKQSNIDLPDKEISDSLVKLEELTEQIFNYLDRQPNKANDVKKLMSRHLPITMKVIDKYREIISLGVDNDNILKVKLEIKSAFNTVNSAFSELLNNLAGEIALDVSTDIDVLKTVLTQDGLVKNKDLKNNK